MNEKLLETLRELQVHFGMAEAEIKRKSRQRSSNVSTVNSLSSDEWNILGSTLNSLLLTRISFQLEEIKELLKK